MQQHRQGPGAIHFWYNLEFSEVHFDINDEMSLMEVQNIDGIEITFRKKVILPNILALQ